jgi:hypothetical protein
LLRPQKDSFAAVAAITGRRSEGGFRSLEWGACTTEVAPLSAHPPPPQPLRRRPPRDRSHPPTHPPHPIHLLLAAWEALELFTGEASGAVRVWRLEPQASSWRIAETRLLAPPCLVAPVTMLAASPLGGSLAALRGTELLVWPATAASEKAEEPCRAMCLVPAFSLAWLTEHSLALGHRDGVTEYATASRVLLPRPSEVRPPPRHPNLPPGW